MKNLKNSFLSLFLLLSFTFIQSTITTANDRIAYLYQQQIIASAFNCFDSYFQVNNPFVSAEKIHKVVLSNQEEVDFRQLTYSQVNWVNYQNDNVDRQKNTTYKILNPFINAKEIRMILLFSGEVIDFSDLNNSEQNWTKYQNCLVEKFREQRNIRKKSNQKSGGFSTGGGRKHD